jgi:hypothetical protein
MLPAARLSSLMQEANEIISIVVTSIRTAKSNLKSIRSCECGARN